MARNPNRPVSGVNQGECHRYYENDMEIGSKIYEAGYECLKRRPRSRFMTESIDIEEARRYDGMSKKGY